jgi:hypothetical protein
MNRIATYVRHKAKPGRRDDVRRIWEKYARDYVAGGNDTLSYYYCYATMTPIRSSRSSLPPTRPLLRNS